MTTTRYAVEVIHFGGRWHARQQVTGYTFASHRLKWPVTFAARAVARALAVELFVKNRDGRIGYKDSHGNDPHDVPG